MGVLQAAVTVGGLPRPGAVVQLYFSSNLQLPQPPNAPINGPLSQGATPFPSGGLVATATTDRQGYAWFSGLPGAEYWAGANVNGYMSWQYGFTETQSSTTSGNLVLNVLNSYIGPILALQQNGLNEFTVSESGELVVNDTSVASGLIALFQRNGVMTAQLDTNGCLGLGRTPASPLYALEVQPANGTAPVRVAVHYDVKSTSGNMGIIIDKVDKTSPFSHGITWEVQGVPCWDIGMDISTNNLEGLTSSGSADMVLLFDYTSGYGDDGTRLFPGGADIMRFTPAAKSFTGKCTTWEIGGQGASRNLSSSCGFIASGPGLSCLELSANTAGLHDHLVFTQRTPIGGGLFGNEALINYNQEWTCGLDYGCVGNRDMVWVDRHASGSHQTRLFLSGNKAEIGLVGLNTGVPLGTLDIQLNDTSGAYNVIQTSLTTGYQQLLRGNRRVNFQVITQAGTASNYLWFNGELAAGSTGASGLVTGGLPLALGIEANDTALSLCAADSSTGAINIHRVVRVSTLRDGTNQPTLAFYDGAPITRPTVTGSKGNNAALTSLIAQLVALGLLIDGSS